MNPVNGTWANKQILVVNLPDTSNAYYSLSGEDPETSGFAYDGPVQIDLDGEVKVLVAIIDKAGNKTLEEVSYKVEAASLPEEENAFHFLETISSKGLIDYSTGEVFSIPASLDYCFGKEKFNFEPGTDISMNKNSVLERAIPCTVTDGNAFWRFVINVHPVSTGLFTRKDVPFTITDWEKITFNDKSQIYKIDDSWWKQPKEPVKLDRSVNHMISWQSVDYAEENMIKFFMLPPKPMISNTTYGDGQVTITVSGVEGYKFGIFETDGSVGELFDQISIDTFKGDEFKGELSAGIFFDSVYQGRIPVKFDVRKRMPVQPEIRSSAEGNFSRKNVNIEISSPEKNKIFVNVSGPVILEENYSVSSQDLLFDLSESEYFQLKKKSFVLSPSSDGAAAYRIQAYSVDSFGNKSKISQYSVIIDKCNFFIDGTAVSDEQIARANGSSESPYSSLRDVLPIIRQNNYVHLRLKGDVFAPNEKIVIDSNVQIDGNSDSRLLVGPKTCFQIRNSSFSVSNILVTLSEHNNDAGSSSLFNVDRGVLYLENVELSCVFGKNGTVVNSDNSVVQIKNSGITSTAEIYSCGVAAVKSKINVKDSRISTVAGTAVNFSSQGGLFELNNSTCKVTGTMGRIAELFDTHSTITDNVFSGDLKKGKGNNKAVFEDSKNLSIDYSRNIESGF